MFNKWHLKKMKSQMLEEIENEHFQLQQLGEFQTLTDLQLSKMGAINQKEVLRTKLLSRLLSCVFDNEKFLMVLIQLCDIEKPNFERNDSVDTFE